MPAPVPAFREPTPVEKLFNRIFGFVVGLGLGPAHIHLLQVRGRKSGRLYATPVDLLELNGKRYLVAPRGRTQWVRNAEAAGEVTLKRGSQRERFRLRALSDVEKLPILKAYLDCFRREVQRYFAVAAGSPRKPSPRLHRAILHSSFLRPKPSVTALSSSITDAGYPASWSGWPALLSVTWSCESWPLFGTGGVSARGSGFGSAGGCAA